MEPTTLEMRAWAAYLAKYAIYVTLGTKLHRMHFAGNFFLDERPITSAVAERILAGYPHRELLFMEYLANVHTGVSPE